ncbi:MAG TPA: hypothetical protein VKD90_00195 [Gemmataceae bacterium]|nr:hypothetical protein [Gemmataceae bacterium]
MSRRVCAVLTTCAVVSALAGCGGKVDPNATVVRGQILYRGDPVAGGMIVLAPNPDRGASGAPITAVLQEDGSFTLTAADGKPVAPGWYRIAVAPRPGTVDAPTPGGPYPGLPSKYRNPALSGLEREVKAGVDNVICFDLDDS